MAYSVTRTYRFEAAHFLPWVAVGHKCRRVHGHNYRVEITVSSDQITREGFVVDFFELDRVVTPLVESLDHRTLNNIEGLENPTAEIIARWFWERVPGDTIVRVYETDDACAEYRAP